MQRGRLRALPGWTGGQSLGTIVRASWDWHISEENLPSTRLIHEIEGLAAAGRIAGHVPRWMADRVEFVAGAFETRGVRPADARQCATLLNSAYAGLQIDYLNTGDTERIEAAVDRLCVLVDSWVTAD